MVLVCVIEGGEFEPEVEVVVVVVVGNVNDVVRVGVTTEESEDLRCRDGIDGTGGGVAKSDVAVPMGEEGLDGYEISDGVALPRRGLCSSRAEFVRKSSADTGREEAGDRLLMLPRKPLGVLLVGTGPAGLEF